MWKEEVMACLKVLFHRSPVVTEENEGNLIWIVDLRDEYRTWDLPVTEGWKVHLRNSQSHKKQFVDFLETRVCYHVHNSLPLDLH
jgi:hypothetical protein